jgi:transposase InsO family protein
MIKPIKEALNEVLWTLREGQAVVGVKRDKWIALIEAVLLDAAENEKLFVDTKARLLDKRFSIEEVRQIAEGYAATIGGTKFGRTRTDEEDAEDARRNLERVIQEVKERRPLE